MKTIIALCIFLASISAYAGTWRDDFENEQDFINDCGNGVWIEDINLFTWENGSVKAAFSPNGAGLITGDYSWKDYTIECKVKPLQVNWPGVGLLLRRTCTFCNPCYYFALAGKDADIYRNLVTPLNSSPFELEMEKWYSLKAIAQGDQLEFYVDGKLVAKAKDSVYPAGKAGFCVFGVALFDDFVMTGPEVKDGGHWDPKAHGQRAVVKSQVRLIETWGEIKGKNR